MTDLFKYDDAEIVMGGGSVRIPVIIAGYESSGGGMLGPRDVRIECVQTDKMTVKHDPTKENDMASIRMTDSATFDDRSPERMEHPATRQGVATILKDALIESTDLDDVLILNEDDDRSGPLGGRSSQILAYVRLPDSVEPIAVAINVYADDKIAAKAEGMLDELEKRTALTDRLDRVRDLLEG